ncbi:MAG TPA: hypothetical protein VFV84_08375 [Burkholderiales bacterium]|nr:hypothetical protein [Burkholderiales bacterium]
MSAENERWIAATAAALCTASRWLSAASLVLVGGALALLSMRASGVPALGAQAAVIALGAVQVYLAIRIEFDRAVFARAAASPAGFAGFDEALASLGWARGTPGTRTPESRTSGLHALVRRSAWLLCAQFTLVLASLWLP